MTLPGGWIADLFGYKDVLNSLSQLMPRRKAIRFLGASLADNPALGVTDVGSASLTFDTVTLRDAYAGPRTAGMLAYVAITQCFYMLAPNLTTWQFFAPSPALALQAAWEINASTGSDNNSGIPGSPLASTDELSRRLCPNGAQCIASQNTTVTIAAGTYQSLDLVWGAAPGLALTFTITCAVTTIADTLTSVVNTVPNVSQGRITVATGPLTARGMLRSTSGAVVGAVTWGMGALNSATDSFVKAWVQDPPNSDVNVANGTTVALDTIAVTINRFVFRPVYHSATNPSLVVVGANFPNGTLIPTQGGSSGAIVERCILGGRNNGGVRYRNCKVNAGAIFQNTGYSNSAPVFAGCVFEGPGAIFFTGTDFALNTTCAFDGAQLNLIHGSSMITSTSDGAEWSNGAGLTAILIEAGSRVNWGTSGAFTAYGFGTAYAVGWNLQSDVTVVCNAIANVQIPSTQNVIMAGNNRNYGDLPGYYGRAACFFGALPDTTALFTSV